MIGTLRTLLLTLFFLTSTATIKDCGGQNALFTITELSQDPPISVGSGQNLSLTLKYSVPEVIATGKSTESVTLNYIPFAPEVEDLCVKTTCPILPGEHDGSSWTLFPSGVSGKLSLKTEWRDPTDRLLLCIESVLTATGMKKNDTGILVTQENS